MSAEQWEAMRGQVAFLTGNQARAALHNMLPELIASDRRCGEERDRAQALQADLDVLAPVGRLYLDAFGEDERVSMVEAYRVSEVEEAVNRWEAEYAARR